VALDWGIFSQHFWGAFTQQLQGAPAQARVTVAPLACLIFLAGVLIVAGLKIILT